MSRSFKTVLSVATILAGTAAITATPTAFAESEAQAPAAQPVALSQSAPAIRVIAAERRELVETLPVTGTIVARDEAFAGTDLNGMIVLDLKADIGDMVKKGDVLAVLDRSMLDTQLAQMLATRAQGEANVDQMSGMIDDARVSAKQTGEALERVVALQKKGFASQAELDNAVNADNGARAKVSIAERALNTTRAQLAVTDAQIDNVRVQIGKTEVRAPADGLVLARDATIGGVVSPSSGALFRIAIGAEFELDAQVAETSLPRLELGMKAGVTLAGAGKAIPGTIRRISPEVNQATRLGSIRIALAKDNTARAGSFARADIEVVRREGVSVPSSAVIYRGEQPFLQIVENGKVSTVAVELGARAARDVEVLSGLKEGQEVISRAGTFVADGDMVTPVRGETTGAIKP